MDKRTIIYKENQKLGECYYIKDNGFQIQPSGKRKRRAIFRCRCGKEFDSIIESIRYGATISCGCLKLNNPPPPINFKHGHSTRGRKTPEYRTWNAMKARCNGNSAEYRKLYTYKGITVCQRWINSFENFLSDMGKRPSDQYSLDRKDGFKGYSPENCRWATIEEQNSNKSSNIIIEFQGERLCLMQWAKKLGISWHTLKYRISNGWPPERAFMTPAKNR